MFANIAQKTQHIHFFVKVKVVYICYRLQLVILYFRQMTRDVQVNLLELSLESIYVLLNIVGV